jgi:hypothetical protein
MANTNPHLRVMENGERNDLIRKSKAGWRKYFLLEDEYLELLEKQYDVIHENQELIERLRKAPLDGRNPSEEIDMSYLKSQFIEMYDSVKKDGECPICFAKITKENIVVPSCGHIICKTCKDEIKLKDDKCPSCRKKILY